MFAGGLAQGYSRGLEDIRRDEEENRRKEEHEYQKKERANEEGYRQTVGQRLAQVDTDVVSDYVIPEGATGNLDGDGAFAPVTKKYTREDAYRDITAAAGKYGRDPLRPMQMEAAGLQVQGARRTERNAQREEDTLDFLRRVEMLPEAERYREAARFASRYGNDGKTFGVDFDENAGYSVTMLHDGQVVGRRPVESWEQLKEQLMSYASPQAYKDSQKMGLERRKVGAAERTAGAAETTANATAEYRRNMQPVLEAQANYYNRRPDGTGLNPLQSYQLSQQKAFDDARNKIIQALDNKQIDEPEARRQLNRLSLRFGGQMREDRQGGMQPVKDNPGVFTDGQEFFRLDDRGGGFTPIPTPQSLQQLGAGMRDRLPPRPGQPRAPTGGTTGSHPAPDGPASASSINRAIAELDQKLSMVGVNPDVQLGWRAERDRLIRQRNGVMGYSGGQGLQPPALGGAFMGNR